MDGKRFSWPTAIIVTIRPPISRFIPRIIIKKARISLWAFCSAFLYKKSSKANRHYPGLWNSVRQRWTKIVRFMIFE